MKRKLKIFSYLIICAGLGFTFLYFALRKDEEPVVKQKRKTSTEVITTEPTYAEKLAAING